MTERRTKPRRDEDKLAYYPWYVRDFNADPPVQVMSPMEEFCYRRLLDYQWLNGSIPGDVPTLARICKNIPVRQMAKVWAVVGKQFPGGVNRRMENERRDVLANIAAKTAHAKKGADGRWNPPPEPDAPDMPEQCPSIPETMPGVCYPEAEAKTEGSTTTHRARLLDQLGPSDDLESILRVARNPEALCAEVMAHLTGMRGKVPTTDQMHRTLRDLAITGERVTGRMLGRFLEKTIEPHAASGKPPYTGYLTA